VKGDEIWYGKFAAQTSKVGHCVRNTSPSWISKLVRPAAIARFRTSAAILGSISKATTRRADSSKRMVRFPVPGPISKTVSLGLMSDAATILSTMPGFFSKCCPCFLFVGIEPAAPAKATGPFCFFPSLFADAFFFSIFLMTPGITAIATTPLRTRRGRMPGQGAEMV